MNYIFHSPDCALLYDVICVYDRVASCCLILQCKHVLAAKLSESMGVLSQQSVTDEHISDLLKAMS